MKNKILHGHTSEETSFRVEGYPYGFRLKCSIRYWLEFKKGYGYRLMAQTTNPRKENKVWNEPKGSTYSELAVMYLDEESHVHQTGVHANESLLGLLNFKDAWWGQMDEPMRESFRMMLLRSILGARETWCRWFLTGGYESVADFGDNCNVEFFRLLTGQNKDNCPREVAIENMPALLALLAARQYSDKSESFYHIHGEPVLATARTEESHPTWNVGRHTGMWSGTFNLPKIGQRVNVTVNGMGTGVVRSYFFESGYFGVEVLLDVRPKWHLEKNGDEHPTALVFGLEIEPIIKKQGTI